MRVHHLNCATLCPPAGAALRHEGHRHLVCHCLLLETDDGLVLVDTGLGEADVADPSRIGRAFRALARPKLDRAETALAQVERLGFARTEVRHVVLTHLDVDHAGGLADFPEARAHVMMAEQEAAVLRTSLSEKLRYRPEHVDAWARWSLYAPKGEPWFGFPAVRGLQGVTDDVLLIPLPGHTRGHCGVAVRDGEGWLLHAGDAYFHRDELAGGAAPLALGLVERLDDVDHAARIANRDRLRELARAQAGVVRVFCAHDPVELGRFAAAR